MPTDRYTKSILTIIAISLLFLRFDPAFVPAVQAQGGPQEVKIVGIAPSAEIPVRIIGSVDGALVPVRIDGLGSGVIVPVGIAGGRGPIPVSLQAASATVTVGVGIRGVRLNDSYNRWEWAPLPVKQAP